MLYIQSVLEKVQQSKTLVLIVAVSLSVFFMVAVVEAATTISTNISTGGSLTVSGSSTLGDAAADTATFVGAITHSTGSVTFNEGGEDYDFRVEGENNTNLIVGDASTDRVGISTTTPGDSLAVGGDVLAASAATTTLFMQSTGSTKGGCIQLEGANDTTYRVYATTTGYLVTEAGACQ